MAYMCNLGNHQQVFVSNQDNQTIVTLSGTGPGQQQQASTGFSTGKWIALPILYRSQGEFILRVESDRGPHYVQLQGSSMKAIAKAPDLGTAEVMPMETAETPSMEPMKPMEPMEPTKPMEPLKIGDMEMGMKPMEMRMGNMSLSMGQSTSSSPKNFCPQCGVALKENDRFCANCGNRLV